MLTALSIETHGDNVEKGFYDNADPNDPRHIVSVVAMIGTEVSELIETIRKRPREEVGTVTEEEAKECADILIRVLDYAGWRGIDLDRVVVEKLAFNRTREYCHGGKCV